MWMNLKSGDSSFLAKSAVLHSRVRSIKTKLRKCAIFISNVKYIVMFVKYGHLTLILAGEEPVVLHFCNDSECPAIIN